DLEVRRGKTPGEQVVTRLGPLQDVDELLLGKAQNAHGLLPSLVHHPARAGAHAGTRTTGATGMPRWSSELSSAYRHSAGQVSSSVSTMTERVPETIITLRGAILPPCWIC